MKILLLLLIITGSSLSARILGINPSPSISHQMPFLIVMSALAEKGHQVTIITTDPLKNPPKNLRQIDMSFTYPQEDDKEMIEKLRTSPPHKLMEMLLPYEAMICDIHFNFPQIKQLLQSEQKFDVVIVETLTNWCYLGFIHKLGSPPVIGFVTIGMTSVLNSVMGNAINPAYIPDPLLPYTDHMSFWERMHNTYTTLRTLCSFYNVALPYNDKVIQKHYGTEVPSLNDMVRNISMVLTTNHFSINYPQPHLPSVIEITGLHVEKKRNPLPKEIQQFLDEAIHGFIYFSLGSSMKSSYLSNTVLNALLDAFSELPQKVLWKFEKDSLPGKPKNVMLAKWLPQQEVLAHGNVRLFITQGGLQSFNEAAYFGVPLIGIPCFADQAYEVAKMVSAGIGEKLELEEITKDSALLVIRRVLGNPRYQQNMEQFSAVYHEHQETSLERAVWWIEYVIRHKGAPHLRSAALDLRWWQLLLLDVAAFILAVATVVLLILYKAVRYITVVLRRYRKQKKS